MKKWIDAKIELPHNSRDVLVTDGNAMIVASYGNTGWGFYGIDFWVSPDVTHWMELPDKPNTNEGED